MILICYFAVYTSRVTHVATQGMFDPPQVVNGSNITSWVKEYSLEYSSDGDTYNGYYFDKDLKVNDETGKPWIVGCSLINVHHIHIG